MSPHPEGRRRRARGGFTLIELIVALAILTLIAGAAVPSVGRAIQARRRQATLEELEVLQAAAAEYFRDVGELPRAIADLERDPGRRGWSGPYLSVLGRDPRTGLSIHAVDAWSQPYRVDARGSVLRLTSAGLGGELDDANDIERRLDVTPIRRELTLARLRVLDQAIALYNAEHLAADPLPADLGGLLARLVRRGFLPAAEPFAVDGWGDRFVADPPGATPVVRLASRHVGRR